MHWGGWVGRGVVYAEFTMGIKKNEEEADVGPNGGQLHAWVAFPVRTVH